MGVGIDVLLNGATESSLAVGVTHPHSGDMLPPLLGWKAQGPRSSRSKPGRDAMRVISGAEVSQNIAVRGRPQGHRLY
jgi:hypothetical protein